MIQTPSPTVGFRLGGLIEPVYQRFARRLVEVNHDVTAKNHVKIFFEKKQLTDVIPYNRHISESIVHGIHRSAFMKDLDKLNIIENINRFL